MEYVGLRLENILLIPNNPSFMLKCEKVRYCAQPIFGEAYWGWDKGLGI